MRNVFGAVILLACFMRDCCSESTRIEPSYPTEIPGWQQSHERGLTIRGTFLLRKNQSTDNGELQIKLIEVIPGNQCVEAGDERYQPRVTLEFVRLPAGKVLCEETFSEKGSRVFSGSRCGSNLSEFGILGIYVIGVNVKDEWVLFELRG
jgi:hypothetical protein